MYISRFKASIDTLTETEKKIGRFVEENLNIANTMSSYEIAERLDVGQTTVIRFTQKLGYKSFREFQLDLTSSAAKIGVEEICPKESTNKTNFKIMRQYQDVINLTYAQNEDADIDSTVNYIKNAEKILIFGMGSSNLFAEYLSNQLINIGFFSICSSDPHNIYTMIAKMDHKDLIILFSETGETKETVKAAKLAYKKDIPIISITRMAKNKLHQYSNVVLKTINPISDTRLEAMSIRCSQLCLIDMIYLNLFKTDYEKYKEMIVESEELINE